MRRSRRSAWPWRSTPVPSDSPCSPAHEGQAHLGDQVRILAERLFGTAPARVAARRRAPATTLGARRLPASGGARRRPSRVTADCDHVLAMPIGLREDGGAPRHQAGADLLVDDRRDAEPRALDEEALDRVGDSGGLDGSRVARARDPRDLTESVLQSGRPPRPKRVAVDQLEHPGAAQLGHLLDQGHASEQVVDSLVHRPRSGCGRWRRHSDSARCSLLLDCAAGEAADDLALGDSHRTAGPGSWRGSCTPAPER